MAKLSESTGVIMAKEIKKTYRIPPQMNDYICTLAKFMNISENDAIKMIIFENMSRNFAVIKRDTK